MRIFDRVLSIYHYIKYVFMLHSFFNPLKHDLPNCGRVTYGT